MAQKFGEAKKELDGYLEKYDKLYNKHIDVTINPQKIEEIKRFNAELYTYIGQIKQLMNEFHETGDTEKIRVMIELYLAHIIPITQKIRDATYVYNNVEYDENTKIYSLIQKKYSVKSIEI